MILFLVRHAKAEDSHRQGDRYRELSAKGRQRIVEMAPALRARGFAPSVWISSPYVRARQTAEMLARELGTSEPLNFSADLVPGADPADVLAEIQALAGTKALALFSHDPFITQLAHELTDRASLGDTPLVFHTPTVLALEYQGPPQSGAGKFLWILHPLDREV